MLWIKGRGQRKTKGDIAHTRQCWKKAPILCGSFHFGTASDPWIAGECPDKYSCGTLYVKTSIYLKDTQGWDSWEWKVPL